MGDYGMNDSGKEILLVAPFTILPGEKGFSRFTYIANKLTEIGHHVTLLTSSFQHNDKAFRKSHYIVAISNKLKYKLEIIPELGYSKNIGVDRIRSHRHFAKQLSYYLKNIEKKPDVIYCAYPMMGSAYEVGRYAKQHQIPFIIDIQDVWPESIKNTLKFPAPITDSLLYPMTWYANRIYKLADYVVGVSESYVQRVEKVNNHAKRFSSVFIGTDLGYFDSFNHHINKKSEEFWITYVGTLSYSYDIETVIKAVSALNKKGFTNIVFKVLGDGPLKSRFVKLANETGAHIEFMGYVPYEKMIPILTNSDLAANAISKGAQQSITNKIGDYLASGLPVLNSSENSEFKQMVEERKLGYSYNPGDVEKLTKLIERLYKNGDLRKLCGRNARKLAEEKFDRRISYESIYSIVEEASL
jgi:glycosyltransferase involved in cell wall biosynthesis